MKKNKVIIIAEAGVNHNGKLQIAKKLIDVASQAGADYVKFQSFIANNFATKKAKKAKYQILNSKYKNQSQFEMLKELQLSFSDHKHLKSYCSKKKIKFLSTPFDVESFEMLKKMKLKILKISSTDLNNIPFLEYISKKSSKGTKIILSTGMGNIIEINYAINALTKFNILKKNISVLHCTSSYPAEDQFLNLRAINLIKRKFDISIGYSDHSVDHIASLVSIGFGAKIIEKHFTLDKKMMGPDHKASLNPKELIEFISNIRRSEKMLGSAKKIATPPEKKIKKIARKSIVAKKKIKKGELFSDNNLSIKRPGTGLDPRHYFKLLGKKSKKNYQIDDLIKL